MRALPTHGGALTRCPCCPLARSQLDAAIAQHTADLARMKEEHRVRLGCCAALRCAMHLLPCACADPPSAPASGSSLAPPATLPRTHALQRREAAAETALVELLYQREARTGNELAARIHALKKRIERLQEARRTLDAMALEGGYAAPAVLPPHGL